MDSFITALVFLIISAIAAWYKKSKTGRDDDADESGTTPPINRPSRTQPARPATPPKAASWEEELKRLLEGDTTPVPPPPQRSRPVVVQAPKPIAAPPPIRPRPIPAPQAGVPPLPVPRMEEVSSRPLARMEESRRAYERASQLDVTVAQHIGKVSGERVKLTTVTQNQVSAEVTQVVSLFKSPRAARQAVIASIILGPPKGLEQNEPSF